VHGAGSSRESPEVTHGEQGAAARELRN
jgi:hypothetical protein